MTKAKRIGVLTGGGDAPRLNDLSLVDTSTVPGKIDWVDVARLYDRDCYHSKVSGCEQD